MLLWESLCCAGRHGPNPGREGVALKTGSRGLDYGHGIALQGTTAEILHFLRLAIEHVARETRQEGLPDVLNELATVRARREELLTGNPTAEDLEAAAGYELQELELLRWIAEATSALIDHRP